MAGNLLAEEKLVLQFNACHVEKVVDTFLHSQLTIGTGDLKTVSGKEFDLESLRKVPLFIFLGDKDENDSVIFRDSYEKEDEDLIFALFGKTPVERWDDAKKLYQDNKLNSEFRLYPDVQHSITKEIFDDIFAFFSNILNMPSR